jgi:drug/metabolite transporter (DMT)-like permease
LDHSANPSARAAASPVAVWAALLTLYVVWGSTYLGIAVAIDTIPPYVMGVMRFVVAGSVMLAWSIARNPGSRPTLREVRDSAIVGAFLLGGAMGLVAVAEQTIPSGVAALLVALLPAWLVVLGRIFVGETISRPIVLGLVIGFAGVAILAAPWDTQGQLDPLGLAAILVSPVLWATGSIFSAHKAVEPSDPTRAIAIQMLSGGVVMAVIGLVVGDWARFDPAAVSTTSLLAIVYLAAVGSIVGYTSYIWLLRHAPLAKIGTYAYVNPVVAFVLGAWLANEPVTPRTVAASVVILFAVALIVTVRSRASRPAAGGSAAGASDAASDDAGSAPRPAAAARPASPAP